MAKTGLLFEFDEPAGWSRFREGDRYVFHGPNREELIVQGVLTVGDGSPEQRKVAADRALQDAIDAATRTAADPALVLKQGLTKQLERPPLEVWSIDAVTQDASIRFLQAVASAPGGVLLVTLECAESPRALEIFRSFIGSIHLVKPSSEA